MFPDFQGSPQRNSETKEDVEKQQIIKLIIISSNSNLRNVCDDVI